MRNVASRPAGRSERARCQMRLANSRDEGTVSAAGRSLPEMSLAFALMAAINGSTGSRATLSCGLKRDQASPASVRRPTQILIPQGWRRKPPETLS